MAPQKASTDKPRNPHSTSNKAVEGFPQSPQPEILQYYQTGGGWMQKSLCSPCLPDPSMPGSRYRTLLWGKLCLRCLVTWARALSLMCPLTNQGHPSQKLQASHHALQWREPTEESLKVIRLTMPTKAPAPKSPNKQRIWPQVGSRGPLLKHWNVH